MEIFNNFPLEYYLTKLLSDIVIYHSLPAYNNNHL